VPAAQPGERDHVVGAAAAVRRWQLRAACWCDSPGRAVCAVVQCVQCAVSES
jgi:hypothetical protein